MMPHQCDKEDTESWPSFEFPEQIDKAIAAKNRQVERRCHVGLVIPSSGFSPVSIHPTSESTLSISVCTF